MAVAIDVEKFFDSLDHQILKKQWCQLLDVDRLTADQYAVFRAITRFSTVDLEALHREFGLGRRASEKLRKPICSPADFRRRVRGNGLIKSNDSGVGIPQGSPISAMLSNLYLLDTDERIARLAEEVGGIYRRYSDDILLICDASRIGDLESRVLAELTAVKLVVNVDKTMRSEFKYSDVLSCDRPLQYLGFEFDGNNRRMRSKTIGRYARRMKSGVASAARAARKASRGAGKIKIRRKELYKRYSHLGNRTFLQYAYRAAQLMEDPTPRRQVRKHWSKLSDTIEKFEEPDAECH